MRTVTYANITRMYTKQVQVRYTLYILHYMYILYYTTLHYTTYTNKMFYAYHAPGQTPRNPLQEDEHRGPVGQQVTVYMHVYEYTCVHECVNMMCT